MMYRNIIVLLSIVIFSSCNSNVSEENDIKVQSTDTVKVKSVLSETDSFPIKQFSDTIVNAAHKYQFDTIRENGVVEVKNIYLNRYVAMILAKKDTEKRHFEAIKNLYSITLKHNSIKKPDSPDITADIYVFNDKSVCSLWEKKIKDLYHQSGGEPLKELYYIETYGTILIHTTTRAFMWEGELDAVQNAVRQFMEKMKREN